MRMRDAIKMMKTKNSGLRNFAAGGYVPFEMIDPTKPGWLSKLSKLPQIGAPSAPEPIPTTVGPAQVMPVNTGPQPAVPFSQVDPTTGGPSPKIERPVQVRTAVPFSQVDPTKGLRTPTPAPEVKPAVPFSQVDPTLRNAPAPASAPAATPASAPAATPGTPTPPAPGRLARLARWTGTRVLPAAAAYGGVSAAVDAANEGSTNEASSMSRDLLRYDPVQNLVGPESPVGIARDVVTTAGIDAARRFGNAVGPVVGLGRAGDTVVGGLRDLATGQPTGTTQFPAPVASASTKGAQADKFADPFELQGPKGVRQYAVPGEPGSKPIVRIDEPGKSPLYTDSSEGGRVSTIQTSDVAAKDAAKLTGAIQARLASGAPEDREFARRLAVTPEHQAMIAAADNRAKMGPRERAASDERASKENIARMNLTGQLGLRDVQLAQLQRQIEKENRDFAVSERDKAFTREGELNKETRTVIDEMIPEGPDKAATAADRSEFIQFLQSSSPTVNGKSIFTLPRQELQQVLQQQLPRFQQQQARNANVQSSFFTPQTTYGGLRGYDKPAAVKETSWRDIARGTTVPQYLGNKLLPWRPDEVVVTQSGARIPKNVYVQNAEQRAALERELGLRRP